MINISVVLYNNKYAQIQSLIKSVLKFDNANIKTIYLIDNSETNNLAMLSELSTKINYIHLKKNIGYGSANNVAIKESIKDKVNYHVVVNPDIHFDTDVLTELTEYLDQNLDVGLAMPDIRYSDNTRQFVCKLIPSPLNLFGRRFLPKFIAQKVNRNYDISRLDNIKPMNIPILSGCFMFLRTKVLAELGGFDERYFMYLEDFDLSRRIHSKYKTMFYPKSRVYHEYNRESYRNKKLLWIHIKSSIKYFNKHGWVFDKERVQYNKRFLDNYYPNNE